jgi:hypothetical protein
MIFKAYEIRIFNIVFKFYLNQFRPEFEIAERATLPRLPRMFPLNRGQSTVSEKVSPKPCSDPGF